MSVRVLKWEVAVDDRSHPIGGGDVVHVAAQTLNAVCVWTVERKDAERPKRLARAFGTGQPIDNPVRPLGSTQAGPFVWHLFEVTS